MKFEIHQPNEEFKKKFEIQEESKKKFVVENPGEIYMNDLYSVGPKKPMGYLPLSTLEKFSDKNEDELTKELNEKGVEVIILEPGPNTFVFSGALYAYHPETLQKLLDENGEILEKHNWPSTAREFVLKVASHVVLSDKEDLCNLIADAYANSVR